MQAAKWARASRPVYLLLVDTLGLKEGDGTEIHVANERDFGVSRKPTREELLNVLDGRLSMVNPFHAP
jgi:antitoxin MazE